MQILKKTSFKEYLFFSAFLIIFFLWDTQFSIIKGLPLVLLLFTIDFKSILKIVKQSQLFLFALILILFHKIFFNIYFDINFQFRDLYFFSFALISIFSIISNYQILSKASKVTSIFFIISMICLIVLNLFFNEGFFKIDQELNSFFSINSSNQGACSFFNLESSNFNFKLFKENSHFGMIASIPIIYLSIFFQKKYLPIIIFYLIVCLLYSSFTFLISVILLGFLSILFIRKHKKYIIIFIFFGILALVFSKINSNCNSRYSSLNILDIYEINKVQKSFYLNNLKKFEYFNKYCLNSNQVDQDKFDNLKAKYTELYSLFENMKKKKDAYNKKLEIQKMHVDQANLLKFKMKNIANEINQLIKTKSENFKGCNMGINDYDIQMKAESSIKDHNNLTVSVYINSLLVTLNSLKKYPLGVGLNNYQLAHDEFTVKNLYNLQNSYSSILHTEVIALNSNDGRNNLLKIITEFGIFSILFIIIFCIIIYKIFKKQKILNLIFLVNIFTQLLSGAGYVNGGFIFSVLILIVLNLLKTEKV